MLFAVEPLVRKPQQFIHCLNEDAYGNLRFLIQFCFSVLSHFPHYYDGYYHPPNGQINCIKQIRLLYRCMDVIVLPSSHSYPGSIRLLGTQSPLPESI